MTATRTRRFYLTPRDVELLASINVGRYMTAQGLEWLHWPTWRARWAASQAAGTPDSYRPAPHLYRRLNHLVDYEILYRLRRPIERSRDTFGRAPDVYMLAALGARLLAERHEGTFATTPASASAPSRTWSTARRSDWPMPPSGRGSKPARESRSPTGRGST